VTSKILPREKNDPPTQRLPRSLRDRETSKWKKRGGGSPKHLMSSKARRLQQREKWKKTRANKRNNKKDSELFPGNSMALWGNWEGIKLGGHENVKEGWRTTSLRGALRAAVTGCPGRSKKLFI